MLVQVKNTCESWSLRNEVSYEIVKQVKSIKEDSSKMILCNVPFYLKIITMMNMFFDNMGF